MARPKKKKLTKREVFLKQQEINEKGSDISIGPRLTKKSTTSISRKFES